MKIHTLLEREDFKSIFESTLESFLHSWTGNSYKVLWDPDDTNQCLSYQLWFCNPLINSIFVRNVNSDVFDSINGEYSYNPMNPFKSIFQKIYLILAQSKLTATIFSSSKIFISPPLDDAEYKLIIGGNTKIRIIDNQSKKVFVLLKEGFKSEFITKERYIRDSFPYIPIPKIIDLGEEKKWFSEEYISGKPPNRFNKKIRNNTLIKAIALINKVLNETKKDISLIEYKNQLMDRINSGISQLTYINSKTISDIQETTEKISRFFDNSKLQDLTIAYCHGDFHQGNILSNGQDFWILDWEYSGEKQIVYDLLIFLLDTRIEEGFANRFIRISENKLDSFQREIVGKWPGIDWNNEQFRESYLKLFLLEDLLFYIEENINNKFYKNTATLRKRMKEYKKIYSALEG